MADFVEIGKTSELTDGAMKEISVQGQNILLAYTGGKYYATASRCPHMGSNLTKGKLEGTVVTCPLHGSQFDLKDGSVVRWLKGSGILSAMGKAMSVIGIASKTPKPLITYEVKIEDDRILIKTPSD
ncbi:MAG: Rieske 2Fe-2S domain-containing protein [Dehalococcoidales bacterium]|nr:Rieske 2Fe-2S domain-containing protein [Dehalococcoidales bacterium]